MAFYFKNTFINVLKFNNLNEVRTYARWSHRRPRRILNSEEHDSAQLGEEPRKTETFQLSPKTNWIPKDVRSSLITEEQLTVNKKNEKFNKKKELKIITPFTNKSIDMLETIIDANGDLVYTKLKNNDPSISQLLLTVKSRRHQIKQDLALLEGKRLIKEALEAKCTLKNLIFSRKSDLDVLKPYLPKMGARLLKMPYKEIQMWSDLSTAPGVMGIFKTPEVENYVAFNSLPITIICDNIREPGNLGAILRTAAGAGIERLMLTKGCVDLWDTKVLRSACGAHFHMQIHKRMEWGDIEKRLKELESAVFVADNKIISEDINNHNFDSKGLKDIVTSMPLLPYYSVQFNGYKNVALILGGETEGISVESFQLVTNFGGARLNIPLSSCIESLNVGTALGIILFEMKRQKLLLPRSNLKEQILKAQSV